MGEPEAAEPSLLDQLCAVDRRHRPIHLMVYGDAFSKKSTLVASMPKPQLIFMFDPIDKAGPFLRDGRVGEWTESGYPETTVFDAFGTPIIQVWDHERDEVIRLIEHYVDDDPYNPDAYQRYARRMGITKGFPTKAGNVAGGLPLGSFTKEFALSFGTIAWDSATNFGLARRKWDEFVLNQFAASGSRQDGKQWWGAEAGAIENEIYRRASMLRTNCAVVFHINDDKVDQNGHAILAPGAPGKLPRRLPAGFGEVYRAYVDGIGKDARWKLQTQPNAMYVAGTQIMAPDGVEPNYELLWPE